MADVQDGLADTWLTVCPFLTLLTLSTTFPYTFYLECRLKKKKKTELFHVEIEVMEGMFLVATQHVRAWDTPSTFYSPNKA